MKKIINFYKRLTFFQGVAVAGSLTSVIAVATTVSGLHSFTSGTVISSSEVNDNFTILKNAVESTGSQTYIGTYNATTSVTPTAGSIGDYYVITTAGTILGVNYSVGDWIIFNGTTWGKIPSSSTITSVFGRTGIISPQSGDYNLSLLGDFDATASKMDGDVLKYNASTLKWMPAPLSFNETDPNVQAFAKSPLPSCSAGQLLKSNGATFSCETAATNFSGPISKVVVTGASGSLETTSVTTTELNYLSGATSNLQTQISANMIGASTSDKYLRGDKVWTPFAATVLSTPLAGISNTAGAITAADTVLSALGKLVPIQNDYVSKVGVNSITGTVTITATGGLSVPAPVSLTDAVNKSYVDSAVQYLKVNPNITVIGAGAGAATPTGTNNSLVGASAGNLLTSGVSNTLFGSIAGANVTTGSSNTGVGNSALYSLIAGSANVGVGRSAGSSFSIGDNNTSIGSFSGVTSGSNNITIGYYTGYNLTGSGNVIIGGKLTGLSSLTNTIILGTGGDGSTSTERVRIDSNGNMGIGTTAPAYTLHVNGTAGGTSAYVIASDIRYKKEIRPVTNALDKILSIQGVSYEFKNSEFPELKFSHRRELGVIAQKVEKVFPEAVSQNKEGFRSVAYTMLISPIIEAIREMNFKTKKLEDENQMLKSYLCAKDPDAPFCLQ